MQFHAGYCLDSVWSKLVESGIDIEKINGLFKSISVFEVEGITEKETKNIDPVVAVANNIITRGTPTKATTFVEETILKETGGGKKIFNKKIGYFSYKIEEIVGLARLLYRSLHLIDPKIKPENIKNSGSYLENKFLKNDSPNCLHPFLSQIWEPQKYLESIVDSNKTSDRFVEQRVDFAIKFPYLISSRQGFVVETDGREYHETEEQKRLDLLRDKGVERSDWFKTIRIKYGDNEETIKEKVKDLENILNEDYFKVLKENYENPLLNTDDGKKASKLVLQPIGIARIQKTLIELISNDTLKLTDKNWNIGIVERDIACGALAIKDLEGIFYNLFELEGKKRILPKIDLEIIDPSNPKIKKTFDVLIDISLLQRKGLLIEDLPNTNNNCITIRSCFSTLSKRKFYTTELIKYPSFQKKLTEKEKNNKNEALIYFLQWIFRKIEFRPSQIEIINAILQLKNTVALLPTGGGKSLTYQLSSFLQPGISIVVDPIKSLMKDQKLSLEKLHIDNSIVINSSQDSEEKKKLMENMLESGYLFVYISPERFLIKEFRNKLIEAFNQKKAFFSYCVIDEVHCVSEWGHDFRTAYLRLGINARNFCKQKNGNPIVLMGLTATASYDVLTDVQRELEIRDKNIIRAEYLDRPELQYHIVGIDKSEDEKYKYDNGQTKYNEITKLISRMPKLIQESNKYYLSNSKKMNYALNDNTFRNNITWRTIPGLIFCPHRGDWFGVSGMANQIKQNITEIEVGTFVGSSNKNEREEKISSDNQDKFLNNELDLMVATKAFGMGIDKPNIRYTVHLNYPSSIESFYQEAGRSGRDKQLALCFIVFDKTSDEDKKIPLNFHHNSFKGIEKEKWVLNELISNIEKHLEGMEYGDKKSIVIDSDNHVDRKIMTILQKETNRSVKLSDVQKAYEYCYDPEKLITNLNKYTKLSIKNKDVESEINKLFWKWRNDDETSKAIYRLSAIGVVDDYTKNYSKNNFTIEIYKKTEQELYLKYLKYLSRYSSEQESKDEANLVWDHKGNSMIQKCTGSLIEFVYREIEEKRRRSIDAMETACLIGLEQTDNELEEFIEMYFESRYYNPLVKDTNKGKESNIDLVWRYIKELKEKIDNIKHLRGATTRLLTDNPNNTTLLLLNSYTYFVLKTKNKEIRIKAAEDTLKAFEIIQAENMSTPEEYFDILNKFKASILKSNSKRDKILEQTFNLLEVKFHNNWLKSYNLQNIN